MLPENSNNKTHKFVLAAQYFLYFGVLGVFLPFFNLYCYELGFSGFQIGVLSAVRTGTTVLFPMFWGILADRFQNRRRIYVFCNLISTAVWLFYLYTTDFWLMLVIGVFYGIFYSPIISFLEAFSMDILGKEKKKYGWIRVWGTVSFIIVVYWLGRVIDTFSIEIILLLIFAGALVQSAVSSLLPDISAKRNGAGGFANLKLLMDRRITVFLICAFLMLTSHGAYYGFFSIHLSNLGFDNTFIGLAWALASGAELLVMLLFTWLLNRFSIERILVFSFAVATIRWLIISMVDTAGLILASQLLHAVTYGAFHIASILYIDRLFPENAKTFGQSVNNAMTYGLGIIAGYVFGGVFFEMVGSSFLFIASAAISFTGGLLLWGFYKFDTKELDA